MALIFPVYDDALWLKPQNAQVPSTVQVFTRNIFQSIAPTLLEQTTIALTSGAQILIAAANGGLPMLVNMGWKATPAQRNNILIFNFDTLGVPTAGFEINVETVDGSAGINFINRQFIVDHNVTVMRVFNQSPGQIQGWIRLTRVTEISNLLPVGGGGGGMNVTVDNFDELINRWIENNNQGNNRPLGSLRVRVLGPNPLP